MLSFIISNVLICTNAVFGLTPDTLQTNVAEYAFLENPESQTLTIASYPSQEIVREGFEVVLAPVIQPAFSRSQIAVQSLPASNSALVNSAMKYVGMNWDCTAVIEQALRDLGYSVGDEGPMNFGKYGTVFYDPSQVQPGDILMRPGHVTLYAGGGMSIQGGFGFGGVVYTDWQSGPEYYTAYVRIG